MPNEAEPAENRNQAIVNNLVACERCGQRRFRSQRGVLQHLPHCNGPAQPPPVPLPPHIPPPPRPPDPPRELIQPVVQQLFMWGQLNGDQATRELKECYEKVVYWRKNIFMLPKGASGKDYIRETTRLINGWTTESPIKECAMYAIHVMPALLLQKPAKTSKSRHHVEALTRRLKLWQNGEFDQLFREADTLQKRLPKIERKKNINVISRKFRDHVSKGNLNSAIKVLTNNMEGGILPLNDQTKELLKVKHPEGRKAQEHVKLQGPLPTVENVIFDVIDDSMVLEAAKIIRGGSGPSGLDADGWRRILVSRDYGETGTDLRKAIASLIRKVCSVEVKDSSLAPLLASRLVPLNKNPGLRPIGVGEVLRRIMGKVVMAAFSEDVVRGSSDAQMCGRSSGSEAAIHAMRRMYSNDSTEAVILVDAANAFNNINREALIHNIKYACPEIATYVSNCYANPARLFVIGGLEISSQEGTTQGDPLGMAIYALGVTPMLNILLLRIGNQHNRMVAFADDITAAGTLEALKQWWDHLLEIGPSYGYFPQPTKSWLIVKSDQLDQARQTFAGTQIKITSEGERHLGAVIGTDENKSQYINKKIDDWTQEINLLAEIAATYPQAAYSAYVSSYQHKLTYFHRTIPSISDELKRVDEAVRHRLIPSLTGGRIINDHERVMLSLPPRLGGMGLKIFSEESTNDHHDSMSATVILQNQILQSEVDAPVSKSKSRLHNERQQRNQAKLRAFLDESEDETKRMMETLNQKDVSNWLTAIPTNERGFELTKQEFRDAIRIRYNWPLDRMPSTCACGS